MELTLNQKAKLKLTVQIILVGNLLAAIFVFFKYGLETKIMFLNGIAVGTLGGLLVSSMELFFLNKNRQRVKFIWLLILKFCIYILFLTFIFLSVDIVSRMMRFDLSFQSVLSSNSFHGFIVSAPFIIAVVYMVSFAFIINFTGMMSKKMGQGMLLAFIKGTYYLPVKQVRVVMFIKLKNSKEAIATLGPLKYHNYLNMVFFDIGEAVLNNRGIIHEYIDDMVVITWRLSDGLELENCFKLYFDMLSGLDAKKSDYQKHFHYQPEVCASLHVGYLVASEMGEVKTQIVLVGDTLNTTARILQKSIELNAGFLASSEIVGLAKLPKHYIKTSTGDISLKGKQESLVLYEITK